VALNGERLSQPLLGRFDQRGGTVGRSDSATFTLPDPERRISRVQAKVLYTDDGYWVENSSAASPVLHNGRLLGAGMRVLLHENDELRIGGYSLSVSFEDNVSSATILRGRTVVPTYEAPTAPKAGAWVKGPPTESFTPLRHSQTASAEASASGRHPLMPPTEASATVRHSLIPPVHATNAGTAPGSVEGSWNAFLAGAGLAPSAVPPESPELMHAIGAMLRIAVGGIHRLVAMRALAKDEIQTDMTMIQGRDNNPLKFAPDAAVALQALLQPAARGFLDGPAALRDAMVDLQSHQVGMVAGMRKAVEAGLERFDPVKLEAGLTARSVLDSLLPAHRRARLWELYLEHYQLLRAEAQDDFQHFFGEAFREAYEAQVQRLEAGPETQPAVPGPRAALR
jgi:predicted component of type VI protein secretion system